MKTAFFVFACSASLLLGACREEGGTAALAYKGNPIDPICFIALGGSGNSDSIDLQSCTGTIGQGEYVSEKGLETYADGSIGYEFKCPVENCMRNPSIAYKYIGVIDDKHAVLTRQSTGGTGLFSAIALYDLRDGVLTRTKNIAGGDRCNAGISDASVVDGKLHYSQDITPFDLANISQGNKAGFKAYNDLQACASCCVGTMNIANEVIDSVTLTKNPSDVVSEDLGPVDACFFGTYNEHFLAGKTNLSKDALKAFGETFNQRCGKLEVNRNADDGKGPMASTPSSGPVSQPAAPVAEQPAQAAPIAAPAATPVVP